MKKSPYHSVGIPQNMIDSIRHMIEVEHLQQRKVAEALGVHVSTIEKTCKRLGLKTQQTGPRDGEGHINWKGGRKLVGGYWYIYCPDHPHQTKQHYVAEHRLIMEEKLGHYLSPNEVVHHIDGDTQNNHPDNLILFSKNSDHLKTELKGKVPNWTPEGLHILANTIKEVGLRRRKYEGNKQERNRQSWRQSYIRRRNKKLGVNQQPPPIDHQTSLSDNTDVTHPS